MYEAQNRLEDEGDPDERRNRIAKIRVQEESQKNSQPRFNTIDRTVNPTQGPLSPAPKAIQ